MMSFYGAEAVGWTDRGSWGEIQTEIEKIYPDLDPSSVPVSNGDPSYTTSFTTTEDSAYIKDTAITYGANAINYLAGILPETPNYLEYAMPKGMTQEQIINALPDDIKYHEPNLMADGYTNLEETQDYKKNSKELYDAFKEMGVNPSPLELVSAIPDILDMFSLLSNKFHKEDKNPYEEGTLQYKIYNHRKEQGEFNGPLAKLKKFLSKHGFNFKTDFKVNPQTPDTTPTDNDFGINAIMAASNAREQESTVKPEFINFDTDIDTFDYMAGGDMYCAFRKPLLMGERPELSLESESSIFGGTELIEKRFDLLHKFDDDLTENIGGAAMYKAMDIIKKNKYLAEISSYNKAVSDINKTNEMLAIFADKLDLLAFANILASGECFYLSYVDLESSKWRVYSDYRQTVLNTIPHIQDITFEGRSYSSVSNEVYYRIREYERTVGSGDWKYKAYRNRYGVYNKISDTGSFNPKTKAIASINAGLSYFQNQAQTYQNELLAHAEYMDSTYGIEV